MARKESNNFSGEDRSLEGTCPACNREFVGYKNQIISCTGCGNIVWQPKGEYNSRKGSSGSKSQPNVIDVEFEEK